MTIPVDNGIGLAGPKSGSLISGDRRENEDGSVLAKSGRVVQTDGTPKHFKAVLEHERGSETEWGCQTVREAEQFIRDNTPLPVPGDTSRDRPAGGA